MAGYLNIKSKGTTQSIDFQPSRLTADGSVIAEPRPLKVEEAQNDLLKIALGEAQAHGHMDAQAIEHALRPIAKDPKKDKYYEVHNSFKQELSDEKPGKKISPRVGKGTRKSLQSESIDREVENRRKIVPIQPKPPKQPRPAKASPVEREEPDFVLPEYSDPDDLDQCRLCQQAARTRTDFWHCKLKMICNKCAKTAEGKKYVAKWILGPGRRESII